MGSSLLRIYPAQPETFAEFELVYIDYFRDNAPGQRECDEALEQINHTINQLDQASLAAISQQLEPRPENTLQVSYKYITVLSKDCPL